MTRRRIGLFFKTPTPGGVKTRLTPPLSPEGAARLYRAFVEDTIALCTSLPETDIVLFHAGGTGSGDPRSGIAGAEGLPCHEQVSGDLGARMEAALARLLERPGDRALILGTDAPDLPGGHILEAFAALEVNDMALGPASDGGYVLVGLKRETPGLFDGIAWSTATVLAAQCARAEELGLRVVLLPPWHDVDLPRDLDHLRARLSRAPGAAPATRTLLISLDSLN